ncbi:creatininase family protein [Kaistia algarum]|uniref:creatininase family protein n=1 Tax=Kaistia algarum TaxID=2083279 RepID=UPI00225A95AB|nr:creatininase family protein [Kaistia algarum]MCX5514195.1 creatininase family protein [Kaistia algarum]
MTLPRPYWHEMQAPDFLDPSTKDWIAVLPVCAIEQHGPHLPVYTDHCIGEGMVKRTVELLPEGLPVTFLPLQPIGKSNEHISSPGTITFSWETAIRIWMEIGDSIARAGVKKLVIVTSHGGNVAIADILARELRIKYDMLVVSTGWAGVGEPEGLVEARENLYGIHGGDVETSIMLHLRPDLVRMDMAEDFLSAQLDLIKEFKHLRFHQAAARIGWKAQDLNPAGAVGNAARATAERGRLIVDHQARLFVELLEEVARFDLSRLWRPSP